jgi:hypothetical protein
MFKYCQTFKIQYFNRTIFVKKLYLVSDTNSVFYFFRHLSKTVKKKMIAAIGASQRHHKSFKKILYQLHAVFGQVILSKQSVQFF